MGLLAFRKRKITANVAEHLEPGEQVRHIVMTQTGATAMATAMVGGSAASGDRVTAGGVGKVHAIVATDRHVYALYVPVWTKVRQVAVKQPIGQNDLRLEGKELRLGGYLFNVLFFANKDARRLADFAAAA